MKKCDVCGKRAEGLGTYATQLYDVVLCSNCYEGLTKFRIHKRFSSIEVMEKNRQITMQEITDKKFPEEVKKQFERWYEERKQELYTMERQATLSQDCLMTSGYNFEGYEIVAYHGVVCGESVLGTGFLSSWDASVSDMLGAESSSFIHKLQDARSIATTRGIEQATKAGGNAIIGVDIDYTMFTNNLIGVIFNGTSVTIRKKSS